MVAQKELSKKVRKNMELSRKEISSGQYTTLDNLKKKYNL